MTVIEPVSALGLFTRVGHVAPTSGTSARTPSREDASLSSRRTAVSSFAPQGAGVGALGSALASEVLLHLGDDPGISELVSGFEINRVSGRHLGSTKVDVL